VSEETTRCQRSAFDRVATQGPWSAGPYRTRRRRRVAGWSAAPPPSRESRTRRGVRFPADLCTCRDKAMALAMLGAGCEQPRSARCAWLTWTGDAPGPSGREGQTRNEQSGRSGVFHRAGQLPSDRTPPGCATPECFVVLAGTDTRIGLDRSGMRRIFRTHRARSGSTRVRRIVCATPMGPSWRRPASTCWCCAS